MTTINTNKASIATRNAIMAETGLSKENTHTSYIKGGYVIYYPSIDANGKPVLLHKSGKHEPKAEASADTPQV